jgi:5-methyltetrahydropteroyltriglutamate--homocysteine methyltransferase
MAPAVSQSGSTSLQLCFGYAYVARDKPNRYSFLPELTASKVEQISIEAAQPNLDLATLDGLGDKTVIFGVISMGDPEPEAPQVVAGRIRAALAHLPPERLIPAPDCGMKYIPRETAFAKLKALAEGAAIVRRELRGANTSNISRDAFQCGTVDDARDFDDLVSPGFGLSFPRS